MQLQCPGNACKACYIHIFAIMLSIPKFTPKGKNILNCLFFFVTKDIALDNKRSDKIVESWIGKPTILKCAIQRKVILSTNYKWSVVSEKKDITRGIKRGGNKTSYTFIPLSGRDFGKYECTIWTAATTVKHEIVLKQIRKFSIYYTHAIEYG